MSSFTCVVCGKNIIDSHNGYTTFCPHYPKEKMNPNYREAQLPEILQFINGMKKNPVYRR